MEGGAKSVVTTSAPMCVSSDLSMCALASPHAHRTYSRKGGGREERKFRIWHIKLKKLWMEIVMSWVEEHQVSGVPPLRFDLLGGAAGTQQDCRGRAVVQALWE